MNNCCYFQELIQAEIDQEITSAEKKDLHIHLKDCSACRDEYTGLIKIDQRLNSYFSDLKIKKLQYSNLNPFLKISSLNYWKSCFKDWGNSLTYCLKIAAAVGTLSLIALTFVTFAWNFSWRIKSNTFISLPEQNRIISPVWLFRSDEQQKEWQQYYYLLFNEENGKI